MVSARRYTGNRQAPEAEFQHEVMALAHEFGWLVWHTKASMLRGHYATHGNGDVGFPDLVLARDGVVMAWELKAEKGQQSPAQRAWAGAMGATYQLLRPSDMDAIRAMLE